MSIKKMRNQHIFSCVDLWNQVSETDDFLYKHIDAIIFEDKFLKKHNDYDIISYVCEENDSVIGFISGVAYPQRKKAYITMIMVDFKHQRKHIGTDLLTTFETHIKKEYEKIESIDLVFFNPVTLTWIIPNTKSDDHPNSPGVDMKSKALSFFNALGYQTFAIQNSYYKDIRNYEYPKDSLSLIESLKNQKIHIGYASLKLTGFNELFDNLNNPIWKSEIKHALENDQPVLIAEKDGQMIGFTGPLSVQDSLRGYFTGIGVHSDYRGFGIGKVLFSSLCYHLRDIGAHYMTLFTGENNPARHIYEHEGFKSVRSWADMRKEL